MKKILMLISSTALLASLCSSNAFACEKTLNQDDWKDTPDIVKLPMSEIVCYNNGFDPVFRMIIDHNFVGNTFWIGKQGGIITSWSETGKVKAFRYDRRVNFWGIEQTTLTTILESQLEIKIGNAVYVAPFNSADHTYLLPPEAIKALSEAHRLNWIVKIRFAPSGTVNQIGSETVKVFRNLYPQQANQNLSTNQQPEQPAIEKPESSVTQPPEQPAIQLQETIQPPNQSSNQQRKIEYCLKYGC